MKHADSEVGFDDNVDIMVNPQVKRPGISVAKSQNLNTGQSSIPAEQGESCVKDHQAMEFWYMSGIAVEEIRRMR